LRHDARDVDGGASIPGSATCRLIDFTETTVNIEDQMRGILRDILSLGGRADALTRASPLLGAIPELDSMAVVGVIAAIEDQFGISVDDDEISGATFATLGSLVDFVASRAT
jgi:acyl carrier protein